MNISIDINNDYEIAKHILSKTDLFYYKQTFYIYETNVWKPIDDYKIRKKVLDILQDKYKQTRVNNIIDIVKLRTIKDDDEINLTKKINALNVRNGIYYLDKKQLKPHDQETKQLYSTNIFNVEYRPGAKCERWNQFLNEVFEPDYDKQEKIALLQEYLGLCLTQDVSFQKALLLLGTGANGKSKIIDVMEAILGEGNYSNLELHQLSNPTYRVELQNKIANFCSEIDYKNKFSSSVFKDIVTGGTLTGDKKFKDPIKFKPYCKFLFATNDLPQTNDTTKGYFRRLLIIKFNRSFEGKEDDKNLLPKLMAELDGIFNWMLAGLERLYRNRNFTIPESSEFEVKAYLENSNSVVSFIHERCEIMQGTYTGYDELYKQYKIYCSDANLRPFSKQNFKGEIEKQFTGKIIFKRRADRGGNHFENIRYEYNTYN